jgi:phosphate:Na+ symporter
MQGFHFWQFFAGIAVFVYAMNLIESSIKHLAGRSFKKYLQKQSRSKLKMLVSSTFITAFLQSSSVVLLMVLSFVGAGLLNMRGALAATLGSNLGTTLDSWVIALIGFKIEFSSFSYPILAVAFLGLLFSKKNTKLFHATHLLIGFALIFISLEWLKGSMDISFDSNLSGVKNLHYLVFIPIGFLITAIIQSSSVTIAITLTGLYNQLIPFESAAAIVIGSELGTTLKFLFGSLGSNVDKKRVAWGNFILNSLTMLIAVIALHPLIFLIRNVFTIHDDLIALVVFQSGINFLSILLFYPFLGYIAKLLERLFKEDTTVALTQYIRKSEPALASDAIELAEKEIIHLINECIELNRVNLGLKADEKSSWFQSIKKLNAESSGNSMSYEEIKLLQGEILEYITEIPKSDLTENEISRTGKIITIVRYLLRSVKNIKDIRHNIEDFDTSVSDDIYKVLSHVRSKESQFYDYYLDLLNGTKNITAEQINELNIENSKYFDNAISEMLQLLKEDKISELESSNLMNVYREIYSSNKALIGALGDIENVEAG